MNRRLAQNFRASLAAGVLAGVSSWCAAQAVPSGGPMLAPSRLDLYAGYEYLHPVNSDIYQVKWLPTYPGVVASVAGYFSPHFGVQAEGSVLPHNTGYCIETAQAGIIYRRQYGRLAPFAHALGGEDKVSGPAGQKCTWGFGATGGLGLDYVLPFFDNRIAIRAIQADFHFSDITYQTPPPAVVGEIFAYRLTSGLVVRFGAVAPAEPSQFACVAQPAVVYPGDPITVSGTTVGMPDIGRLHYEWASNAGKVAGTDSTATIQTGGLAPGEYTVTGRLVRAKVGRAAATCSTMFTVHPFEPPTLSCSADPSTVVAGGQSSITAAGVSPQNRPLSYSYQATGGQIAGNGPQATLQTGGASPGTITVTCNVADDLGKTATAVASVVVTAPPPAAVAAVQSQQLCSISFERDRLRPDRVDNEAKGCLDDVALNMNRDVGAKLLIVGNHDVGETDTNAAERAMNVRQYLVDEKGIDAARIEMRISDTPGRTVENTLIPPGASYDPGPVSSFDPTTVRRSGQAYGRPGAYVAPARPRAARRTVKKPVRKKRTVPRARPNSAPAAAAPPIQ